MKTHLHADSLLKQTNKKKKCILEQQEKSTYGMNLFLLQKVFSEFTGHGELEDQ